ncbi:hypothetical protein K1719_015420 [Acacia pycnantha]|nr:hypothetical protein K1719_015420 [Acacia pycnantha]
MLNGSIPEKLQTFSRNSFLGNSLCGKPLNLDILTEKHLEVSELEHSNGYRSAVAGATVAGFAEVLGKGTFGTAYKATMEDGPAVAVKRLRDVTISDSEFKEKIEAVGAMDHENLVPLKAYYYNRDPFFGVSGFVCGV